MTTRRNFLATSGKGALLAGAAAMLPGMASASGILNTESSDPAPDSQAAYDPKYKLPFRFGLGGVPLGNEFQSIPDKVAFETLEAAWDEGVRLYDVAPWYGLGLAERRFGMFLHNKKREDYIISSKVGKMLHASKNSQGKEIFPYGNSPMNVSFDYSASAVRRSIEDSLQRLGIDSLDIVYVHDVAPDNNFLEGRWLEHFDVATKGAFPELEKMKKEGLIKAWGVGTNCPEPVLKVMDVAQPDIILLASQYSLIDHENALNNIFPKVRVNNVSLMMGSNLNAGFLSGSNRYNYGGKPIPEAFLRKRQELLKIAKTHSVDLRTAALQFASYPDVAAAIIPGARTGQQIREDWDSMNVVIPQEFWQELKSKKLIAQNAPVK